MGLPGRPFTVPSAFMTLAVRSSGVVVQDDNMKREAGEETTPCAATTPLGVHDRHVRCKWSHAGLPRALPQVNASAATLINVEGGLRGINKFAEATGCVIEKS